MSDDDLTFPGGLPDMLDGYDKRRTPFEFGANTLPPLEADLEALAGQTVPQSATELPPLDIQSSWDRKRVKIAEEFIGQSELAFLNAQLVANLRKRSFPRQAPDLFQRLWAEQSEHLLSVLDLRWLVSSVQTFADHGQTPTQREVGQALRMLFGLMKIYEYERLFSGTAPETAYGSRNKVHTSLPLQMKSFSLDSGGLDTNLIAPIWTKALNDPTIAPLADHLLSALNADPGTVFRRLKHMRNRRATLRSRT
ncbi:hypothetical protein ABLN87_01620 [Ruegeria sp. SCPT10]|uniref:hypothetical protein n=1 Tax=Ruegeria sp. SCP10 TaxID=3141377 RepID=UPI00333C15DE